MTRLTQTLFYLWLFLLPWQTRYFWPADLNGFWEYGSYSFFLTDLLFLAWAGLALIGAWKSGLDIFKIRENKWLSFGLGALVLGSIISLFFAADKNLSLYYFARLLAGVSLIWLVPLVRPTFRKVSVFLVSSALIQAIFGLTQFLLQRTWANKWLGLALHMPEELGVSVVEVGLERWLRAYGSFPHPNTLAAFLLIALILVIFRYWGIYQKIEEWYQKDSLKEKILAGSWKVKSIRFEVIFIFLSYLIILAGLIVTFSRSAWLGFGLAFILFALVVFKSKDKLKRRAGVQALIKMAVSGLLIFLFFFFIHANLFLGRTFGEGRLEQKSFNERKLYQDQAFQLLNEYWLLGAGLGNYTLAVHDKIEPSLPSYLYQPVHNIFLLSWVEIGVLALLFGVGLIGWLIGLFKQSPGPWQIILSSFVIMGMFDHYFWSLPVGIWMFWLIVTFTNYQSIIIKEKGS